MGDNSPIITRYGERMCPCVVAMLPVWEDGLRKAGLIKRDLDGLVTQGGYNGGPDSVEASAGTHDGGGVLDLDNSLGTKALPILRQGAAAWWRTPKQSKLFPYHIHLVVVGCPHLSAGAAHQIEEYRKGRNGLLGRLPDDGPHVPITTWQQALAAWTKTQKPDPASTDWSDMASKEEIKQAVREVLWEPVVPAEKGKPAGLINSSWRNNMLALQNKVDQLLKKVK